MKYADYEFSRLCEVIDDLEMRLEEAEARAKYYQEQYTESLNASISHSKSMIGGMLRLCLEKPQIFESKP